MPDVPGLRKETPAHETLTDRTSADQHGLDAAATAKVAEDIQVFDASHDAGLPKESIEPSDAEPNRPSLLAEYATTLGAKDGEDSAAADASNTSLDEPLPDERLPRINKALLALPLGYAIRFSGCSTRLSNAAVRAGFDRISLKNYLSDPATLVRELHQLQGIGRKTIDEAIERVERFVEAAVRVSPAASSGESVTVNSAVETTEDGPPASVSEPSQSTHLADLRSPRERLADAVARLPDKEQFVIEGRFGLNGQTEKTLQELADEAQVTRERIRQIEVKALRHLRLPMHRVALNEFLRSEKDVIWRSIAGGNDLVSQQEFRDARSTLECWQLLAIELVHENLHDWLVQHATRIGTGWLRHGADPDLLRKATQDLEAFAQNHALPMPMATATATMALDQGALDIAAENSSVVTVFEGYLSDGRAGARARRAVRLHAVATRMRSRGLFDIATLAGEYRGKHSEDSGGPRALQMQMEEATNLFCRLYDNLWFALPAAADAICNVGQMPFERDMVLGSAFETNTIGGDLVGLLESGPQRHVDLRKRMADAQGDRIAESSVGAVLASNPCFRRVAPGIFDLCRPGSVYDEHGVLNELFLDERQCRAFCQARYGGAPVDWYPAWGPSLELWLARWARVKAEPDLFRSLMFVCNPSAWPAPADELDYWCRIKERDSTWLLGTERRSRLGRRFIEPGQFLSTLAHLVFFGWTSWVAVNRTTDARGDVHDAADILAILVKAGLAQPANDWQSKHAANPMAAVVFHRACHEMHVNGALTWDGGVLAETWAAVTTAADGEREGWIEPDEFAEALELWRTSNQRLPRTMKPVPA
jgi:GNAT superfamily N-acetyltransferase